jgi:hypothetical protein
MENSRSPLTTEAQTAVSMTAVSLVTAALGVSMYLAGGGVPVLVLAMLLSAISAVFALHGWRQALSHGLRTFKDDDSDDGPGPGGGGPERPPEPDGPSGGVQFDWDRFTDEFWTHVNSRERVTA